MKCHLHFSSHAAADLHDPLCAPFDPATLERLQGARRKDGSPLFGLRHRKHGKIFVSGSTEHYRTESV